MLLEFQSSAFDHSATSPEGREGYKFRPGTASRTHSSKPQSGPIYANPIPADCKASSTWP